MASTFYVSDISNSTLNITLNTYSLQDALNPYGAGAVPTNEYGEVAPYLFHTGCEYNGTQNCTTACQDPVSAFSSLHTLHNCMMYPVVADQYSQGNLTQNIVDLARTLGIEKSIWPSTVSSNIADTIGNCLSDYCNTLEGCMNAARSYEYDEGNNGTADNFLNHTGTFYYSLDPGYSYSSFDLCEYLPASVNQDIGGIGV